MFILWMRKQAQRGCMAPLGAWLQEDTKVNRAVWEPELLDSSLDHLSKHFHRIYILQNLKYILFLLFSSDCNNCIHALMASPWSEL